MSLELGSLAEWIGGIGGFLAAGAAVVAWRVNQRMLSVEERRDLAAQMVQAREQAGSVFVLGAKLPGRTPEQQWAIYLYNGSSKPIFDICVESQRLTGKTQNHVLRLGALPPGQFVVPSHPSFHWGSLIDLALAPEQVDLLVKGNGNKMIVRVDFKDAQGRKWSLSEGTNLSPFDSV